MTDITITLDSDLYKRLKTRAKKELLTEKKLVEDIVRRSMLSYKSTSTSKLKADDPLLSIFSREKRGRKKR